MANLPSGRVWCVFEVSTHATRSRFVEEETHDRSILEQVPDHRARRWNQHPGNGRASSIEAAERPAHHHRRPGYGDLGFHGNPQIKTPRLDALARESVRFRTFYVSPVCSPTRSSLMTGRYHYRTGVVDTFRGRSMMHPDEVTLAEMLGSSGYRTGIFGKWAPGRQRPAPADRPGVPGKRWCIEEVGSASRPTLPATATSTRS